MELPLEQFFGNSLSLLVHEDIDPYLLWLIKASQEVILIYKRGWFCLPCRGNNLPFKMAMLDLMKLGIFCPVSKYAVSREGCRADDYLRLLRRQIIFNQIQS